MNRASISLAMIFYSFQLFSCGPGDKHEPADGEDMDQDIVEEQIDGMDIPDMEDGEDAQADDPIDGVDDDIAGDCVSECGNGIVECDELCDDGMDNSDTESDACRTDCTNPGCGDGVIDWGLLERCDDGNRDDTDGCSSTCQIEAPPTCGDSNVDYDQGEECDDGNGTDGDGCNWACLIEVPATCGDGVLDIDNGEQCDDGNIRGGDGCGPSCQYEPIGQDCGNDAVEGLEVCDDGNPDNGDSCNPTCNLTNTTELFAGSLGVQGLVDGVGPAAQLGGAGTITVDDSYIYYADGNNFSIRRIEIATRQVETMAGTGTAGYLDDLIGTNAQFGWMEGPATDGNSLWVADAFRLRKIDLSSPFSVTTVAGSTASGHNDGFGAAVQMEDARGLTFYNGYVYFVDSVSATLRRFDPATTEVVTLAGTPYASGTNDGYGSAARFVSPRYMTSDNSGMLYIGDTIGGMIRTYNTVTTYVGTFAGTGTPGYLDGIGTSALVHTPRGMTSDGTSIYWAEVSQHTVRQGILATTEVSTLVGTHCGGSMPCSGGYNEGVGVSALFDHPFSIAFHYGTNSIFVVDGGNYVIRRVW